MSGVEEVTLTWMSLREREEPGMTVGSGLGRGVDVMPSPGGTWKKWIEEGSLGHSKQHTSHLAETLNMNSIENTGVLRPPKGKVTLL